MSSWEENQITGYRLLNIAQELNLSRRPDSIEKMYRLIVEKQLLGVSGDIQHDEISSLSRRLHKIERRVDELENASSTQSAVRIEPTVKKIFSEIQIIKKMYIKPMQSDFMLIIVHNAKTLSNALDHIQPGLDELEDEFPDLCFDPWILHSNEIHEGQLQQSKLIFQHHDD